MLIETNDHGISLDSYMVGYLFYALQEVSECLAENDINKAMRKIHEGIKHVKDNITFKNNSQIIHE